MSWLALLPDFFNFSLVVGAESDDSSDSLDEWMGLMGTPGGTFSGGSGGTGGSTPESLIGAVKADMLVHDASIRFLGGGWHGPELVVSGDELCCSCPCPLCCGLKPCPVD